MRSVVHASFGALWLRFGAPFGVLMALVLALFGDLPPMAAVLLGASMALPFGVLMALIVVDARGRLREAVGPLPQGRERAALRAVNRGPVPEDPEVRGAACRVAAWRLQLLRRQRGRTIAAFSLATVFSALAALTGSSWQWLLVAFFVGFLALTLVQPRRLERRIQQLSPEGDHEHQSA